MFYHYGFLVEKVTMTIIFLSNFTIYQISSKLRCFFVISSVHVVVSSEFLNECIVFDLYVRNLRSLRQWGYLVSNALRCCRRCYAFFSFESNLIQFFLCQTMTRNICNLWRECSCWTIPSFNKIYQVLTMIFLIVFLFI